MGLQALCVNQGNTEQFTNSILQLIQNEELRKQMGIEGETMPLRQKWDMIFDHLLWHYYNAIEEPKSRNSPENDIT